MQEIFFVAQVESSPSLWEEVEDLPMPECIEQELDGELAFW
jgi:hypothetical protein